MKYSLKKYRRGKIFCLFYVVKQLCKFKEKTLSREQMFGTIYNEEGKK
jgi:hypothetical protein